jgi:hypothetical protein
VEFHCNHIHHISNKYAKETINNIALTLFTDQNSVKFLLKSSGSTKLATTIRTVLNQVPNPKHNTVRKFNINKTKSKAPVTTTHRTSVFIQNLINSRVYQNTKTYLVHHNNITTNKIIIPDLPTDHKYYHSPYKAQREKPKVNPYNSTSTSVLPTKKQTLTRLCKRYNNRITKLYNKYLPTTSSPHSLVLHQYLLNFIYTHLEAFTKYLGHTKQAASFPKTLVHSTHSIQGKTYTYHIFEHLLPPRSTVRITSKVLPTDTHSWKQNQTEFKSPRND